MLSLAHNETLISRSSSKWSLTSTCLHILGICIVLLWNVHESNTRPKKLLVKTVSVREFQQSSSKKVVKPIKNTPPKPIEIEQKPEIAAIEVEKTPLPIELETPKEIPQEISQEISIQEPIQEPIQESIPEPQTEQIPEITSEPVPEPIKPEKPEPVQKKETVQKETPKKEPQKPTPKPTSNPASKTTEKQTPKVTPKPQTKPAEKTPTQKKPDTPKPDTKKADTAKQEAAKQEARRKEAEQRAKQQKLNAALEQLNKASAKNKALVAVASEPQTTATQTNTPRVTTLESDSITTVSCQGAEEYASKESHYASELIRRVKLTLRLPEYGEVRISLTLYRSGKVKAITVTKSPMKTKTIEQQLKGISFPAFGSSFPGEQEHTFSLVVETQV